MNEVLDYLHLLKKTLVRFPLDASERATAAQLTGLAPQLRTEIDRWSEASRTGIGLEPNFNPELRWTGKDWPADAETMIGLRRMDNLQERVMDVLQHGVPGDLAETGVWRGGAAIFMRGILKAYREKRRCVWVADSFQGLPKPDAVQYPVDAGDIHWTYSQLAIPMESVRENFSRYGLLDQRVKFLPGWFRDTLPQAPIKGLAVLRVDADMYESTIQALNALYPKVSPGGYVIIDDYGPLPGCTAAVHDFRAQFGIVSKLQQIEWTGAYWQI